MFPRLRDEVLKPNVRVSCSCVSMRPPPIGCFFLMGYTFYSPIFLFLAPTDSLFYRYCGSQCFYIGHPQEVDTDPLLDDEAVPLIDCR